jgi:hypothetical protein
MPRFLEGKAGAKSLYNQFRRVVTECHIFCEEKVTTAAGLSQVHIWKFIFGKKEPHSSGGSELWGDIFFFRRF